MTKTDLLALARPNNLLVVVTLVYASLLTIVLGLARYIRRRRRTVSQEAS
jgi:hypothetical protein